MGRDEDLAKGGRQCGSKDWTLNRAPWKRGAPLKDQPKKEDVMKQPKDRYRRVRRALAKVAKFRMKGKVAADYLRKTRARVLA